MKCSVSSCDKTAEYGFTTCKRHRGKEKTIARYGERVAIDYTRTGGPSTTIGSHGKRGKLIEYKEIPPRRKRSVDDVKPGGSVNVGSALYALVDIDGEGKQFFMWEWVVPEKDFEKLGKARREILCDGAKKLLKEIRDEERSKEEK